MPKLAGILLIILAALALAVPIGAQTDEPMVTEEPQPAPTGDAPVATEPVGQPDAAATEQAPPPENAAYVRFAHFAPDAGAVDILIDDQATYAQGVEYLTVGKWMAVPGGTHSISVGEADPVDVNLAPGTWTTMVISGSAADGTLSIDPVQEQIERMRSGVGTMTFVNALTGSDLELNFIRDGQIFINQLAPLSADTGVGGSSTIPVDFGVYTLDVVETANPDNIIGELGDTTITETNVYLLAAVGTPDDMQLVWHETPRAEILIARGELPEPGTIVEAAQSDNRLAPFAEALEAAGLTEQLSGEGPYTVFAPIDYAMGALRDRYDTPEALAAYLNSIIVEGDIKFNPLIEQGTVTALDGSTLEVALSGNTATVAGAEVLAPNIPATNGTIHIVGQAPGG